MKKKLGLAFFVWFLIVLLLCGLLYYYGRQSSIPVMQPKGMIGQQEKDLMIHSTLWMLLIVIPVFIMAFVIIWKYREDNTKAKYMPDWDKHHGAETIWWTVPCIIVVILSVLAWKWSHQLDPFKPIKTDTPPMVIQAVALDWKWLFIYPEQNIATVNYLQFPEKTPINFEITADAPMNSFWLPQVGGQIYAMPGMRTKLHLIANEIDTYKGSSANLSGKGFADMRFTAKSTTRDDFDQWVETVRESGNALTRDHYILLAKPTQNHPVETYVLEDHGLFDWIVMKYMMPMPSEK